MKNFASLNEPVSLNDISSPLKLGLPSRPNFNEYLIKEFEFDKFTVSSTGIRKCDLLYGCLSSNINY